MIGIGHPITRALVKLNGEDREGNLSGERVDYVRLQVRHGYHRSGQDPGHAMYQRGPGSAETAWAATA